MTGRLEMILRTMRLPAGLFVLSTMYIGPLRRRGRYRLLGACGVLVLLMILAHLALSPAVAAETGREQYFDGSMENFFVSLLFSFLAYLLSVGLVLLICEIPVRGAIYYATCAYLTQHSCYCMYRLGHGRPPRRTSNKLHFSLYA